MTKCGACRSTRREDLDASLRAGLTLVSVARLSGVPVSVLKRHRASGHVGPGVGREPVAQPVVSVPEAPIHESAAAVEQPSPDPAGELEALKRVLDGMLAIASPTQKVDIIAERRRVIAEASKIAGPAAPTKIRVTDIEGYADYETAMFDALEPYPDARAALAAALKKRLARSRGGDE
jgi:hypothetical protein